MNPRILISACLLGERVRYDGNDNAVVNAALEQWRDAGWLVPVCPEVMGGLPIPRPPAEIQAGNGLDVIEGRSRVLTNNGADVTASFVAGAEAALNIALKEGCRFAILAASSPSCGNREIYDGEFSGRLISGFGTTAALLQQHGIEVFNQGEIDQLIHRLAS